MNLDKNNKWLTLAANVGVLIGIIILILEQRIAAVCAKLNLYLQTEGR
jgi:hypothetical protein